MDSQNNKQGHITDALGYFIHREYPIRIEIKPGKNVISFLEL